MILLIAAFMYLVVGLLVFFIYCILDFCKHGRPNWHDTKWYMVRSVLWPLLPLGRLLKNLQ